MTATRPHWWPAYVGIGSNLDEPAEQVRRAFAALGDLRDTRLALTSSLYRSAPIGPSGQPDYVNAVAALLTRLGAAELLKELLALESAAGRERGGERWGPRVLDLDLLVYGTQVVDAPGITVPHPRIAERNFVLLPLAEIAPSLTIPGRASVARLAAAVSRTEPRIERMEGLD